MRIPSELVEKLDSWTLKREPDFFKFSNSKNYNFHRWIAKNERKRHKYFSPMRIIAVIRRIKIKKNGSLLSAWNSIDNTFHLLFTKNSSKRHILGPICFPMNVLNISLIFVHNHRMAQFFNLSQHRSNLFDFWIFVFSLFLYSNIATPHINASVAYIDEPKRKRKPRGYLSFWRTYLKFIFEVKLD